MATTAYGTHTGIETGVIGWGRRIASLRLRSVAFALAVFAARAGARCFVHRRHGKAGAALCQADQHR
jgi:hypothetical protein